MTKEIAAIQNEIQAISLAELDIAFLEALSNNVVYCLNKYLKESSDLARDKKKRVDNVMTDILETLSKEINWAKEELEEQNEGTARDYLAKAKQQVLDSMQQLFD